MPCLEAGGGGCCWLAESQDSRSRLQQRQRAPVPPRSASYPSERRRQEKQIGSPKPLSLPLVTELAAPDAIATDARPVHGQCQQNDGSEPRVTPPPCLLARSSAPSNNRRACNVPVWGSQPAPRVKACRPCAVQRWVFSEQHARAKDGTLQRLPAVSYSNARVLERSIRIARRGPFTAGIVCGSI